MHGNMEQRSETLKLRYEEITYDSNDTNHVAHCMDAFSQPGQCRGLLPFC